MVLNCLADGNASIDASLVVGQVQYQQVLLVLENTSNLEGTLLAELAVGKVQVGQSLVSS